MKNLKNWIPAFIIMAIIFGISAVPGKTINQAGLGRESYHIGGHFILFVFLCFAYFKATKNILLSFVLTVLYGISDEFHQTFTPNRSSGMFDIIVNSCGALLSSILIWKLNYLIPKKLRNWLLN